MLDNSNFNQHRDLLLKIANFLSNNFNIKLKELKDLWLDGIMRSVLKEHPNPVNRYGSKIFSQNEEDGITLEIISRLNLKNGVFAEFGVDTGLEANTIVLAMLGWKGFWVSGMDLSFHVAPESSKSNFVYKKEWITIDNILEIFEASKKAIRENEVNVISLDLDGNDYYFVEKILEFGAKPDLFIVEYNPKFPPPIKFRIPYDRDHNWNGSDYYGCSIQSYIELFKSHEYFLVCSSGVSGSNAFFIREAHRHLFRDVPEDIKLIWSPSRYIPLHMAFPTDPRTVQLIIHELNKKDER